MRTCVLLLAAVMALPCSVRADDRDALKPLIAKALKAAGDEKLTGAKAWTSVMQFKPSEGVPATIREYTWLPDRRRLEQESEEDGKKSATVTVLNGDKVWTRNSDGSGDEKPEAYATRIKGSLRSRSFWQVLVLDDPGAQLTALGESKEGDRAVIGIKVVRPASGEARLYFDKEDGLMLKVESFSPARDGQEDIYTSLYDDFRDVSGIMVPFKRVTMHNGKVTAVSEVIEFKVADELDSKLFEKP